MGRALCLPRPSDAAILFRDAMQGVIGKVDFVPEGDSQIHRFHVPGDKPGTLNGVYCLHLDAIATGWYGTWKDGGHWYTWSARKPADPLEAELIRQRQEQSKRQREAEQHQRQQAAAEYAKRLWRNALRADPEHPYLIAKGCRPYNLRQHADLLLVPLYHSGKLVNLQRIGADGQKRFLSGGRVKSCYSPLGLIATGLPLYICEGWATGATLHAETGHPVACAMNSGNLLPVAQELRARYPEAEIVLAGDDDRRTKGNPGRTAANAAAAAVGGLVVFPDWPEDAPLALTDFNDLANWRTAHEPA